MFVSSYKYGEDIHGYIWLPDIVAKVADSGNIQRNEIMPKNGAVCLVIGLYLLPASRKIFVFIKRSMCRSYSKNFVLYCDPIPS